MLQIIVPGRSSEYWDEKKEEFVYREKEKDVILKLEHSLISISKWESKWCIPFVDSKKTDEQVYDYIRCMALNSDVPEKVFERLSESNIKDINAYISAPMTASTIRSMNNKKDSMTVTSELVYYWMIMYGIPHEFEKWHFNRLLMLIRICSEMQKDPKKRSKQELGAYYRELNKKRKAAWNTKG